MAGGLSQSISGTGTILLSTACCISLSSACIMQTTTRACGHCYDTVSQCCCDSDAFGAGRAMCNSEASCGVTACLSTSPVCKVQLPCILLALTASVVCPLHKLYQGLHCACNVCLHMPAKALSRHVSHNRTLSLHACTGCVKVCFTSALSVSPCKCL